MCPASTPRPGPSQPVAANDDDKYPRVLTVEQWQQKANEKWLKHFPWLIISGLHGFMAEMGTPDMPLKDPGTYYNEPGGTPSCTDSTPRRVPLHRAQDAAEAYPDLDIVDHVVRSLAELLGRSGNFHLRFKELQEVLCETNLELQCIHSVRWLSRGLAVQRLADNLPAAVILLYENDPKAYLVVTSLKFHFMLFFFADVLKELNALNLKFQRRQVDVTHVLQMVDNTRLTLRNRYLSDADDFGDGSNELSAFLSKHASSEKREVKVTGTDSTGAPTTHEYTLHEQNIKGQKSGPGLEDCITLAKGYVKELLKRLESRMKDLGSLDGAKLFTQGAYPKSHSKR
ncbi:unnamed protein product [Closterium sp. NIES-53]